MLSFARARELYPALSRADLRECCEAAWTAACAEPGDDLTQRFDRALVLVVWARRGSRTRLQLDDLVDRTIPRIALEPFLSRATAPAEPIEPPAKAPPRAPAASAGGDGGSTRRIPLALPIPAGAAVAMSVAGVAVAGVTENLPVTPLTPASSEDDGGDDRADRGAKSAAPEAPAPAPAPAIEPAPIAPALGWGGLADGSRSASPDAEPVAQESVVSDERTEDGLVSRAAAPVPVAAPTPVAEPEPEPEPSPVAPPVVPEPSVTATGPAAPAAIQVQRPEPPALVQVRVPVEEADEQEDGDEETGSGVPADLSEPTDPEAIEGELEEAAAEGIEIEAAEDLAEQGIEIVAPTGAPPLPTEVPPVAETTPPPAPETVPPVAETTPPPAPETVPPVAETTPPPAPETVPPVAETTPPPAPETVPPVAETVAPAAAETAEPKPAPPAGTEPPA